MRAILVRWQFSPLVSMPVAGQGTGRCLTLTGGSLVGSLEGRVSKSYFWEAKGTRIEG